jgi:hypothetical protein
VLVVDASPGLVVVDAPGTVVDDVLGTVVVGAVVDGPCTLALDFACSSTPANEVPVMSVSGSAVELGPSVVDSSKVTSDFR